MIDGMILFSDNPLPSIHLITDKLESMRVFYLDILGLRLVGADQNKIIFEGIGSKIIIYRRKAITQSVQKPTNTIMFEVVVKDVDAICKKLQNQGIFLIESPKELSKNIYGASFYDPEGYHIRIISYPNDIKSLKGMLTQGFYEKEYIWKCTGNELGMEYVKLHEEFNLIFINGLLLYQEDIDKLVTLNYQILCDKDWTIKNFKIEESMEGKGKIALEHDGIGNWKNYKDNTLNDDIAGCFDIDIPMSSFCLTLTLNRADMRVGQSITSNAINFYLNIPWERAKWPDGDPISQLEIECIDRKGKSGKYKINYRSSNIFKEIETDEHGIVIDTNSTNRSVIKSY